MTDNIGEQLLVEKFPKFQGAIWEKKHRTPEMPRMDKVKNELEQKISKYTGAQYPGNYCTY